MPALKTRGSKTTPRPYSPREVTRRLKSAYGPVKRPRKLDPLDELVLTILSQHTSDTNSLRGFHSLLARFGSLEHVRRSPLRDIRTAIQTAGLANQKAPRIKNLLDRLHREQGKLSLDHLKQYTDDEAIDYLTSFDGVGRKTAACVLLFACNRPVLPVDTHVYRVSQRLSLIDGRTTADQAHDLLQARLPDDMVLDFHMLMVRHGRQTCRARSPRCDQCVLRKRCPAVGLHTTTTTPST